MSYTDPFDRDEREYLIPEDDEENEEQWECAYPGRCLMPDPLHHRSECHTIADMKAYYAEMERLERKPNFKSGLVIDA